MGVNKMRGDAARMADPDRPKGYPMLYSIKSCSVIKTRVKKEEGGDGKHDSTCFPKVPLHMMSPAFLLMRSSKWIPCLALLTKALSSKVLLSLPRSSCTFIFPILSPISLGKGRCCLLRLNCSTQLLLGPPSTFFPPSLYINKSFKPRLLCMVPAKGSCLLNWKAGGQVLRLK